MVVSHDTFPTNRFFHRSFQPLVVLPPQISAAVKQLFNFQLLGLMQPFCSLTFLLNVVTESLKTNVRVCFAQPSHSGAECDPRHRGAVFA